MDFEKICKVFTIKEPYYGIILSSMNRKAMPEIGSIGVRRSGGVFELDYNPAFIENIPIEGMIELLKHECLHICLNHVTLDTEIGLDPIYKDLFAMAIDMEANSYINTDISKAQIPGGCYADQFGWEKSLGAREYLKRLIDLDNGRRNGNDGDGLSGQNENNQGNSDPGDSQSQQQQESQSGNETGNDQSLSSQVTPFDTHKNWPKTQDDADGAKEISVDLLKTEIEDLVMRAAEETEKGCGSVPEHIKILIDKINKKKPKPVCDWKRYFRRNIGNAFTDLYKKSKKRPSKRFPDAAGNRHQRKTHVLVAIDTSGSINMKDYKEFMGQIMTLSEKASFHVVECNTQITREYDFNGVVQDVRGGGGTRFNPPIEIFLNNRKLYDKIVYFTDGGAEIPKNTPKDMLWVISSDGIQDKKRYQVNGAEVVFIKK